MADVVNLATIATAGGERHPAGYRSRSAELGPTLGASLLGGTVYELDPGQSVCPYHYENTEEEWVLVVSGAPTLRTPQGERTLAVGDVVCFPEGPEGGHKVTNATDEPVRVLMLSSKPRNDVSICVYPDSDKVGVWPPGKRFRLSAESIDYWDGEAEVESPSSSTKPTET